MTDLWLIDAFTDVPFRGNPAGVCWLDRPADPVWMQQLAMEMNQAETAFIRRSGEGLDLRWFTPVAEVDLCGHATLAGTHFLRETGRLAGLASARFATRSGVLTATPNPDGSISMDFPATPPEPEPAPPGLLEALGTSEGVVMSNRLPQPDLLVRLPRADAVHAVEPDMAGLRRFPVRAVVVTAPGSGEIDFVSRVFAPRFGVDEDPVTGSAHCMLAPYWTREFGRTDLTGFQASPRGGRVRTSVAGDRVLLTGTAVTVLRGTVELP